MLRSLIVALFLLLPHLVPGQTAGLATPETSYQPRAETTYQPTALQRTLPTRTLSPDADPRALLATETGYNPRGTQSSSKIGLISVRRDDPSYANFLLGMQQAAIKTMGAPLNVAPLSAETLAEQAEVLTARGVEVLLVDSPDPADAEAFFKRARFLQRQAAMICSVFPRGSSPPLVLASPILYGERAGEEAIRFVGNTTVEVVYVIGKAESTEPIEDFNSKVRDVMLRPFANVAQKITVTAIDPDTYTPGLVPPAVVVVPTSADSTLLAPTLRKKFPDSKIVAVGESPEVVKAFEEKQIDVRVRPDYQRLLTFAIQEARQKSTMPIVVHPTMDKHWD